MRELDLTVATIYTQLLQQGPDAEFEVDFPENGSFSARTIKGRRYWYYNGYDKLTGATYQRYAVHKLIVATQRRTDGEYGAKRDEDISQAGEIIEAMHVKCRWLDLAEAWIEAWERGPAWRDALGKGRAMLPDRERGLLADCIARAGREMDMDSAGYGF